MMLLPSKIASQHCCWSMLIGFALPPVSFTTERRFVYIPYHLVRLCHTTVESVLSAIGSLVVLEWSIRSHLHRSKNQIVTILEVHSIPAAHNTWCKSQLGAKTYSINLSSIQHTQDRYQSQLKMWTPLQQQRGPTDQQHAASTPSSSSSVPLTSTTSRRRGSLRRSLNKTGQPEMPRLTSSVSGPSALPVVGGRALPLDASFRSDISVLSIASANNDKRKSWFCGSCSYRNCDMNQATCALCGSARGMMSSSSSTPGSSSAAKQTIFTIDSSIQLLARPNGEGVALCSTTTCSRTTGTSVSTRVMSNTTAHKNTLRRIRPRTQDDEEVVQPPVVSHHTDDEIDDDTISIASEDTFRRGSLSSQDNSNCNSRPQHPSKLNAEASKRPESPARSASGSESSSDCSSSDSSSRRRAMPHDDPMEQPSAYQQQRRNRRRCRQDTTTTSSEDHACDSPRKPVRATEEPLELSPLPSCSGSKSSSNKGGRKKKSIKDYFPGLVRRNRGRRRSSGTESTAASSTATAATPTGKMEETPSTNHTSPLDESFPYCTLDLEAEEDASFHNDCDHFAHVACGTQVVQQLVGDGRAMPRRAVAGIYDL